MAKTAIITGATGGIGTGFVREINGMEDIDEIWAVGRNREKLDQLKSEYPKVVPIEADLSSNGISVIGDLIKEKAPDVRLLVNNAGIASMGEFSQMTEDLISRYCRINCEAPAILISAALPYMSKGSGILNVSSASSFQPDPYLSMYSASKVFLKNLSRALGMELKAQGILITSGSKKIHVDPFQYDDMPHDADFILITNDHYDHFSVEDIGRAMKKDTVLIVPEPMRGKAEKIGKYATAKPGRPYNIYGLEFETVPAYNIGKPFHSKRAGWVGYILKLDGERVYIAGDTDATEEAKAVKCDIALVPVGGTYTMNAKQAAELVNTIKPQVAVPVHYGGIVGKKTDGDDFQKAVAIDTEVVIKIKS